MDWPLFQADWPFFHVDPLILTLIIAATAFLLFITELIPAPITALATTVALMVTGIVDQVEGLSGFSNEATITVLSMLILAGGVQRTGLVNMIAHWIIDVAKGKAIRFLLVIVVAAGVFSAFVANTPVVAILMPVVITVAYQMHRSPSKFLMPLAFATTLGGMITLVGTSTNILASSISERMGYGEFHMFLFTPVGVPVFIVGAIFLMVAYRWVPERHSVENVADRFRLRDYLSEVVIMPGSKLIGKRVEEANIRPRYEADIIRIIRGDQSLDQPLVGVELREGDVLVLRATMTNVIKMREEQGLSFVPETKHQLPTDAANVRLVEVTVAPHSFLEGSTLQEARFRHRYDAVVLAIKKRSHFFQRRLHALILEPGDSLLVAATPEALLNLQRSPDFVVALERAPEKFRRERMPVALLILASVILAASFGIFPIAVAALSGVVLMVLTGCIRMHELAESIPWGIIFLLAGLIPLGIALEKTGAAALLAGLLVGAVGDMAPIGILGLVYLTAMVLTEFMSNNAAVALTLPVAAEVAQALSLNPFSFIMAATFGASLAFMSPIGYQTYLMVYGPGEYKFGDFFRVGFLLNVVCMIVAVFLINLYWPAAP